MATPHVSPLVVACALALAASAAFAQLRIGQTVGVTGAVAATVKESMQGAQLYLDHVNAKGGVGGEKIEIITLDDAFDVKKAEANARTLIEERGVLALFMSRGTPHTEAINTVLEQHRVALIGPSTGAIVLIFAPILFPVAMKLGIDPVHFGIIMVVNMEVGMCHPPVGLNLYVASGITKMGITELTVAVWPWLMAMLGFLAVVTYWPGLSLWFPRMLGMM